MTVDDLNKQAAGLVFQRFDETDAVALGGVLLGIAAAQNLPVVINIRTPNRTLFHAALPGSAGLNDLWAKRKSNTALLFQEASLLVGTRHRDKGESLAKHGLDEADYADHGGAVPICVAGVGVVACVTVSGLPQLEDHALVVRGIESFLAG
jgi:uncharacterized protein (UPF0303 family)